MSTRFSQVTRLTAAALAAVAVLAACSPGDGIAVQSTAGTATPSPELLQPETRPSNEELQEYQDVTGQGERFDQGKPRAQWAPVPLPGSLMFSPNWACTVGPAVTRDGQRGFLTAGHCGKASGDRSARLFNEARQTPPGVDFGEITEAVDTVTDTGPSGVEDHGVVWVPDLRLDSAATRIANRPIAGVMRADAVRALPVGTPICVDAGRTGVWCAAKRDTDEDLFINYVDKSEQGDSGAPVFVVDSNSAVLLIGLLSEVHPDDGTTGRATFLEPALRGLGARVLTDPGAEAADPHLLALDLALSR
ncbi:chymotrypsin family serine protease [Mycolicibacterium austroafricanum]|uniref:hypothetical protein n=1 Tax=Mycolicibacterium austroafricanum TaxID=39687 RepID=UPI0011AE4770|nr:hypothetical protein [Mycolicibacterium austroafricanum]